MSFLRSLSARLLVLTIFFVMLSEVLIYTPSIARYREEWLQGRLAAGHLAALSVAAAPERMVTVDLERELLDQVGAAMVDLIRGDQMSYMLGDEPIGPVAETIDLRDQSVYSLIVGAFGTLLQGEDRIIRIQGVSPRDPDTFVMVVLNDGPLRAGMIAFSYRILALSIIISLITASLVFLSLRWLMVRPMERLTDRMVAFRNDPEDDRTTMPNTRRADELGVAGREFRRMQVAVRQALHQKARLAALGTAMSKINHDLRNILATASLVSERLVESDDPDVRRTAPRLLESLDRAVGLCGQTLDYIGDQAAPLQRKPIAISDLLTGVRADLTDILDDDHRLIDETKAGLTISADRDQIIRALDNVIRNAFQAGATAVALRTEVRGSTVSITIADNGPGLPPRAREHLFKPFAGSARPGGTGLGLAIAREIAMAHRGDLVLAGTSGEGTAFRMIIPTN
ncbi:MAG: HAMP domain-containing sensor histidine kinase [Pseudomonadota bacterium]